MEMCGARERKESSMPGYYEAMLQQGQISSECAHQIDLVSLHSQSILFKRSHDHASADPHAFSLTDLMTMPLQTRMQRNFLDTIQSL